MQEVYYEHSSSGGRKGNPSIPSSTYEALGYLFGARYNWQWPHDLRLYFDIGWGAQFESNRTRDLTSRVNSTPFCDLGTWVRVGQQDFSISLRYLHISNAGFVKPNLGQNQLFLQLGTRF